MNVSQNENTFTDTYRYFKNVIESSNNVKNTLLSTTVVTNSTLPSFGTVFIGNTVSKCNYAH